MARPSEISPPKMFAPIVTREATSDDMPQIQAIYAPYVLASLATFEEEPPSTTEFLARRDAVLRLGLPFLVAEGCGKVVGYSYATAYRPRAAYRFTVEDSVYVARERVGCGIGSMLLRALVTHCQKGPWRQMIAVIGDSSNAGSKRLHESLGFRLVGTLHRVGFKLGQWVDTVIMERELRPPERVAPAGASDATPDEAKR